MLVIVDADAGRKDTIEISASKNQAFELGAQVESFLQRNRVKKPELFREGLVDELVRMRAKFGKMVE